MFSEEVKLRVRFSLGNLRLDDDVLNIFLFMIDYADKLIGMAMKQHQFSSLGLIIFESM